MVPACKVDAKADITAVVAIAILTAADVMVFLLVLPLPEELHVKSVLDPLRLLSCLWLMLMLLRVLVKSLLNLRLQVTSLLVL